MQLLDWSNKKDIDGLNNGYGNVTKGIMDCSKNPWFSFRSDKSLLFYWDNEQQAETHIL